MKRLLLSPPPPKPAGVATPFPAPAGPRENAVSDWFETYFLRTRERP